VNGQRHAGTRQNGRDFSERDVRSKLHDGSDNQASLAENSDHSAADDLNRQNIRDVDSTATEKPDLIVDSGNLPATARELRDKFAASGRFFDRGVPVKIVPAADSGPPSAVALTPNGVVMEAHNICRPCKPQGDDLVSVTLPERVGRMYLHLSGEWDLPPLAGITTAPVLSADGAVRSTEGYDPESQLWCAKVPQLQIPERPSREQAEAAFRVLRETFRTFPFADAPRIHDLSLGAEVVDLAQPPGLDESTFLVGLVTAICRPELWLAPGFLVRAPEISGAGSGKGLLMRAVCAIAFGIQPRAFTKGGDRQELDKRLASDLIEAAPILFLDNVNGSILRSDILASVLTERPARVRPLGRTGMVALNSTAFIAVTGNGLTVSEDLARRFIVCELDARCEDPEQRPFAADFLQKVELRRADLLSAAVTIWRWGRQNGDLQPGRPLGSFEQWAAWCRDPLLALGCRDPVDRIDLIKADDPHRRNIVEIFQMWHAHHRDRPVKAKALAEPVRGLLDPQRRGRQFMAARLVQLAGTRAGGFVLTRQQAAGKWGKATYSLVRTAVKAA
jgi:putative DNA primase/helicase